jgi:dolichol-phosphate mannosyltransferase
VSEPSIEDGEPIVSLVVPVYNEGVAVEPVLRSLTSAVTAPHEILVVYDYDEDPTVPVLARLAQELPAIRGYRNRLGRGVLNALKAGLAGSKGRYVVVTMADGSDEPKLIDTMVRLAEDGADVVAAARYMPGGRQVGGPRLKRLLSRVAGLSLHHVAGVRTHDPTNNFKLYSRRFLDEVTIESKAGFELALELTVKATIARRRVAEIPTTWRDRTSGTSNFRLRKWLPHYVRWYLVAMRSRLRRLVRQPASAR